MKNPIKLLKYLRKMINRKSVFILLFALIILAAIIVIVLFKPLPLTLDYSMLKTDVEQSSLMGIKNRKQIDISNEYVALIKGGELNLFKENELIETFKGGITSCQLSENCLYYVKSDKLLCYDIEDKKTRELKSEVDCFIIYDDCLYVKTISGSIGQGNELSVIDMKSGNVLKDYGEVDDFCTNGEDVIYYTDEGHTLNYSVYISNVLNNTSAKIADNVSCNSPNRLLYANGRCFIYYDDAIEVIDIEKNTRDTVSFTEDSDKWYQLELCSDGKNIYAAARRFALGQIGIQYYPEDSKVWKIDIETMEKELLCRGDFFDISFESGNLIAQNDTGFYLIDRTTGDIHIITK